jgi:hypothetical protein
MDVLHLMIEKAATVVLLSELARTGLGHCTSMYANDVVTFFWPTYLDLHTCSAIVEDFGVASGLRTNLAKCSLHPIRCSPEQVELAHGILGCGVAPLISLLVPWFAPEHPQGYGGLASANGG